MEQKVGIWAITSIIPNVLNTFVTLAQTLKYILRMGG